MYKLVDLFAGAGGITRGFVQVGSFQPVFAVEADPDARASYIRNFHQDHPDQVQEDVTQVPFSRYPKDVDVLVGGPPCQDFTQLTAVRKVKGRERNNLLWNHYIRLILRIRPKVFVIENVPNLLTDDEYEPQRHELKDTLRTAGYKVEWGILNTANYGVPQSRQRAFVIGTQLEGQVPYLPFPTLESQAAWDAIRDLGPARPSGVSRNKEMLSGIALHVGRDAEVLSRLRYRYVLPEGNRMHLPKPITIKSWVKKASGTSDGYGRMFLFRPSSTIRCEGFKPEKGRFLHPVQPRPLTLAEMAQIQTFPEEHQFHGSYTSIGRQIGNAVPPRMAFHLATVVRDLLTGDCNDVPRRPKRLDDLSEYTAVRGNSTSERVLSLLRLHIGRPVPWWKIELVVQQKSGATVVDWGTPLRELVDDGYDITVCSPGLYQLNSPNRKELHGRPIVSRLLRYVRGLNRPCDLCDKPNSPHVELIRSPESGGVLLPDNVIVLCNTCRSSTDCVHECVLKGERQVYAWLSLYRHYEPVARALIDAVGLPDTPVPPGPLPPEDAELKDVVEEAVVCDLCGNDDASGLRGEWIRPVSRTGGLQRRENAWVLCSRCQIELDHAHIKVPGRSSSPDEEDAGEYVPLRSRFSEVGFLTLKEAYYRNWLLQYAKDPVVRARAKKALLDGDWQA